MSRAPQQAALADQSEGLQIHGHGERQRVCCQRSSGLMHAVVLIAAGAEAADHSNAHVDQIRVALITYCRGTVPANRGLS